MKILEIKLQIKKYYRKKLRENNTQSHSPLAKTKSTAELA